MLISALKKDFDSGKTLLYIFAATPLSMVFAYPLPAAFTPFVLAAFAFPVFFYYARRERYFSALLMTGAWGAFEFVIASLIFMLEPNGTALRFVSFGVAQAPFSSIMGGAHGDLWAMAYSVMDAVYYAILAGISGGAFFLALLAAKLNEAALAFAHAKQLHGFTGAFLAIRLDHIAGWLGQILFALGPSAIFYMKLERRRVDITRPIAVMALGVLIIFLSQFLGTIF